HFGAGQALAALDQSIKPGPFRLMRSHEGVDVHSRRLLATQWILLPLNERVGATRARRASQWSARAAVTQVVTGDAVVLEVSAAAFPIRMVARLLDMLIQLVAIGLFFAIFAAASRSMNIAAQVATVTVALVLVIVGYPTILETLTRGKTVGKLALGLR